MPLTNLEIKNAAARDKPYKLSDSKGMYLLVKKSGKYFRFDYRFAGKRKTLALGVYPETSLSDARHKHIEARKLLEKGIDPAQYRKTAKEKLRGQTENNFAAIALEWHTKRQNTLTGKHAQTIISRLENNVFPWIGNENIADITAPQILKVLRRIENRGAIETAHRVNQICSQVFRYAIATSRAERDPTADLRGALTPTRSKHMAAITDPKESGALLRAIDGYNGHFITKCGLQLAPLVFVRPGELRRAEWSEINMEEALWKIPARKMKRRVPHIVPLSLQALNILREEMNLRADKKGSMVGDLVIEDGGDKIDLRRQGTGGWSIPSKVEDDVIKFKETSAKFILFVEKSAVWERLNEDKVWKNLNCKRR